MSKTVRFSILFCLGLMAVIAAGNATLFAQDQESKEWRYKGEVSGSLGLGQFYHGDNALGKGLDLAGGAGFRPFSGTLRGLGFEVLVNRCAFKKEWGDGYSYDGNTRYHF